MAQLEWLQNIFDDAHNFKERMFNYPKIIRHLDFFLKIVYFFPH